MGSRRILQQGKLNIISHTSSLNALERKAIRFARRRLTQNQLDVNLVQQATAAQHLPCHPPESFSTTQPKEDQEVQHILRQNTALLQPIGIVPTTKPDNTTRLFYENVNGINASVSNNSKLEKVKEILDDMEVDIFAFNEHKINFLHKENRRTGLGKMFHGGETMSHALGGNFAHPVARTLGRRMEGGTGIVSFGTMASLVRSDLSGMDSTGLARWTYMTFSGRDGHVTTVIVGYNPCRTTSSHTSSSYQLQRAYLICAKNDDTCPRRRFEEDIINLLKTWREEGRRIILCLDMNDHVYLSRFGKTLVESPDLDLKESILSTTGQHLTATYFRGSRPIDAVWTTPDVDVQNACSMPIGYGVGDHRSFMIDFSTSSLVGLNPQPIVRPAARRLNTKIPRCSEAYNTLLESQVIRYDLINKLRRAHDTLKDTSALEKTLNHIDSMTTECMRYAERRCRKLKSGRIPFSPEASIWIKRTLCYRSLLRFWAGKIRNRGNLKRQARRCSIQRPFHLSIEEITARLQECKAKCNYFVKHGKRHRQRHLRQKLDQARDRQDEEAERRILLIIKGEKDRAFWRRLNWSLGQHRGSSVRSVQVEEEDGQIVEYTTQEEVQSIIWSKIHQERYHMAEEAPICQGRLRGDFGYCAATKSGEKVLDGSYHPPYLIHDGTELLFQSIAAIRRAVPPNSICQIIDRDAWQYTWKHKNESTSSSQSGLHFGHYVSGAASDIISDLHALKTSIALYHGIAYNRWKSGLCVMLEKTAGVRLISKLRAILLMEADFNAANKIIFGQRMLANARKYQLMPEEIFSEKQRMADDGILSKVLFYDVSRQLRAPSALASVDAANCYDRVSHAVASLIFRAFGATLPMTLSMLTAIQQMKFFLRTAFGDSKTAAGSRIHLKTQGFMQGNGASPAGWTVVSIVILHAHKSKGHGATFLCPISKLVQHLSCILYVDDNDLIHLSNDVSDTIHQAHKALQDSVTCWSNLLIATGGALKPAKCFYYLIDYMWDNNGQWKYADNCTLPQFKIEVSLPDGSTSPIQHLSVHTPSTTLGGTTCPSGNTTTVLAEMSEKALVWANKARNSGLSPRDFHISVKRKFWPKMKYGLCANTCSYDELVTTMHKPYFWMAPLGGLIRSAKRELRYLDTGFYGLGFPHWGIEALIEAYKKFFSHFGTRSAVGIQLQMSVELMTIEIGTSPQPFTQPFSEYGSRVTACFCKSLWAKLQRFRFKLILDNPFIKLPREHDNWIMLEFKSLGYTVEECERINRVRLHQQVLYVSDICHVDGASINNRYFRLRRPEDSWSEFRFGKQSPPERDLILWKEALNHLAPGGRLRNRLGQFLHKSHIIHPWYYDPHSDTIFLRTPTRSLTYTRQPTAHHTRHSLYSLSNHALEEPQSLLLCSTTPSAGTTISLQSTTSPPTATPTPNHFHKLLQAWSNPGIWSNLKYTGDGSWLYEAIQANSLICVSDGSYIRQLHPFLCSTAIIMECSTGRGRLSVSFLNHSPRANAFRAELLGLMTVHLILRSLSLTRHPLSGSAKVYSDCTGALHTIATLSKPNLSPTVAHADVLKLLALYGQDLHFARTLHHVKAHQDDNSDWKSLSLPARLNCACDAAAKQCIIEYIEGQPIPSLLPLEPVSLVIQHCKITADTCDTLRFHTHLHEASHLFSKLDILSYEQFNEVAWKEVHSTLHSLPKMFQVFACKQVFGTAAVLSNLAKQKNHAHLGKTCPSCTLHDETCEHVLSCPESGRVLNMNRQIQKVYEWLEEVDTVEELSRLISDFLLTRGTMMYRGRPIYTSPTYDSFLRSQERIGWRRTLEGMISKELLVLDTSDVIQTTSKLSKEKWMQGLISRLLEAAHGQWIYRNLTIHDRTSGHIVTQDKERLLQEIESQMDQGGDNLREQDLWMLDVNLGCLETSTGEREAYWLLAIKTAREQARLHPPHNPHGH